MHIDILDVSNRGIGLVATDASTVPVGSTILLEFLSVPELHQVDGVVAWQKGARLGVRLNVDGPSWPAWVTAAEHALYPFTRRVSHDTPALWDLYARAGYFSLSGKSPADFDRVRACFTAATRHLLKAPELGTHIVWGGPRTGEVWAALSILRVYSETFLGFQMAKPKGPLPDGTSSRRALLELHRHVYEQTAMRSPRYIIGHTQVREVWSRDAHYDFTRRFISRPDMASIWRFRALHMDARMVAVQTDEDKSRVVPATPVDEKVISDHLRARHGSAFVEALDLTPESFDLLQVRSAWSRAGLHRERNVRLIRRQDSVAAAAILESAHEGVHVFGLLDCVRLVLMPDAGHSDIRQLIQDASAWYMARGRTQFCLIVDGGVSVEPFAWLTMSDLGLADQCILSADLVPDLVEHIFELTGSERLRRDEVLL